MEGAERITLHPENWLSSDFYSDQYRLRIVLSNLLSNAIKYQDPEKEAPYVKVHLSDKGDCHQLLIADNGLGIPPDKVDDVWELFYQSGHDQQGSGMGLFIVKETVQKLGGSVEIRAQAGQGTTFEIKLPKNGSERQNYPADR
jgi:signal transduction histidine kinase